MIIKLSKGLCSSVVMGFAAAYFNDIIVGAVCSREEKLEGQKRLYIMTLGCLAPYRRLGIGSIISPPVNCNPGSDLLNILRFIIR